MAGPIGAIDDMKIVFHEALRYTAVAACALVVDMTILWVLVHYFSWWYLGAATASFLAGLLVGYALSVTAYERTSLCVQFDKHLVAGHRFWKSFGKNEPHR